MATPSPEREGGRFLVPAGHAGPGLGAERRAEAAAQPRAALAPRFFPRAADGRTRPGEDVSHRVSLCGLGLCDAQVLGLLQPHDVQKLVFILWVSSLHRHDVWL